MSDFSQLLEEYAAIAAFVDEQEAKLKSVKKARDNAKAALLAKMSEIGIDSGKSREGHQVAIVRNTSVSVVDAEAFFDFVFERGDADFLTKRASVEAVQQYLEVNNELPPGVEATSAITLRFTRAK